MQDTMGSENCDTRIVVHRVSGDAFTIEAGVDGKNADDVVQEVAGYMDLLASQVKLLQGGRVLDSAVRLVGGEVLNAVARMPLLVAWTTEAMELSIHNADKLACTAAIERAFDESMKPSTLCADWDSMRVLIGFSDGTVTCFKIEEDGSASRLAVLSEHDERVSRIVMSNDVALTVSDDGGLGFIDLHGFEMVVYDLALASSALFADFERGLVLTGGDNEMDVSCWQLRTLPDADDDEELTLKFGFKARFMNNLKTLHANFVERVVVGGGYSGGNFVINVWMWSGTLVSATTGEYLEVSHHFIIGQDVLHADMCLEVGKVVGGDRYGELVVWSLSDGGRLLTMNHDDAGTLAGFVSDFEHCRLASVGDHYVHLWDLLTGLLLTTVSTQHELATTGRAASFLSLSMCADLVTGIVVLGTLCSGLLMVDFVRGGYIVLVDDDSRTFGAIAARLPAKPSACSTTSLGLKWS